MGVGRWLGGGGGGGDDPTRCCRVWEGPLTSAGVLSPSPPLVSRMTNTYWTREGWTREKMSHRLWLGTNCLLLDVAQTQLVSVQRVEVKLVTHWKKENETFSGFCLLAKYINTSIHTRARAHTTHTHTTHKHIPYAHRTYTPDTPVLFFPTPQFPAP